MRGLARWNAMVARYESPRMAALYVLHRVLQGLSGGRAAIVPYMLVAQPIGNKALAGVNPDPHTVVQVVGPGHPLVTAFPRPPHVIAQRFAQGHTCYAASVKGQFAGHVWIANGTYVEDEVRCMYEIADPSSGVWDYDVYVEPRFRMGRTMARLWKAVDDALAAQGVRWSFSRINRFNGASLRSHGRLGAVPVGRAIFAVFGSWQCHTLQPPALAMSRQVLRTGRPVVLRVTPPPGCTLQPLRSVDP